MKLRLVWPVSRKKKWQTFLNKPIERNNQKFYKSSKEPHIMADTLDGLPTSINIMSIILKGHVNLLLNELRRRLYSNTQYYIFRRDVTLPISAHKAKIPVTLRRLHNNDIPKLLNLDEPHLTSNEVLERVRRLRLVKSGIEKCYVVVTPNDTPIGIGWLIDASQNKKIQTFFSGGILPLNDDEILSEGGYTVKSYRGQGIQRWRICEFLRKAMQSEARWVIGYFNFTNFATINTLKKNGFEPYMIRSDKWRLMKRYSIYKPV